MSDTDEPVVERRRREGDYAHLPKVSHLGVEVRARKAAVFAANLLPIVHRIQAADPGCGYQWIVDRLNERGITAPRGGKWNVSSLHLILKRVADGRRVA